MRMHSRIHTKWRLDRPNNFLKFKMTKSAHILDCTIRDGSYVVDYQFTLEDTFIVAAGLADAGIRRIEVGHGLGLNAQNSGKGHAAISDASYIRAACSAVSNRARVGCFFIPGIGTADSLRAAVQDGLGFIRVGIDVDDFAKLKPFIELGKSLGVEVWANLMKSYILPPAKFGEVCRQVGDYGADIIALVDSAGGMTPSDIAAYTSEAIGQTKTSLAFHGHNNLSLAVANCLRFVECGGTYVDGSLSGMGRSGGNAATELLAALLSERLHHPADWKRLVEFADATMEFCAPDHARPRAVEIGTGINYFHSSFREKIVEPAANRAKATLFRTIVNLPASSRKMVTDEIANTAARLAVGESRPSVQLDNLWTDGESREGLQPESLEKLAERLHVLKGKSPQKRIVSIAHAHGITTRIGPLRRGTGSIVAHIEAGGAGEVEKVQAALGGACDFWMLDKRFGLQGKSAHNLPQFIYDDDAVVARAVSDSVQMLCGHLASAIITGRDQEQYKAIANITNAETAKAADVLIACDSAAPATVEDLAKIRDQGIVLLIRPYALTTDAFQVARKRGLRLWRLDCGTSLVAEAERLLATYNRYTLSAGTLTLGSDTHIVAAGVIGQEGDFVLDSKSRPRFILGVADGKGGMRSPFPAEAGRVRQIQQWIANQWGL